MIKKPQLTIEQVENVKYQLKTLVSKFAERVAPVYKVLDWHWSGTSGIPDQYDIEATLRTLIHNIQPTEPCEKFVCRTGGLVVGFETSNESSTHIFMRMEISEDIFDPKL